jgi:hypothetical protein
VATETLVSFDIENGKEVVDALDRDGVAPDVALWAKLPDYDNWRLIIASRHLDEGPSSSGYPEIFSAIKKAGISIHRQPTIFFRAMDNPMIHGLREAFSHATDTYGMRLGGQKFGDKYLEDAFVYRIR